MSLFGGGISPWRIGLAAAIGVAMLTLFLMWKAEHARASRLAVVADTMQAQYKAQVRQRIRAAQAAREFEQALIEREQRLRRIRSNTRALERDLRNAREDASEQYTLCMDEPVPESYRNRLRSYIRNSEAQRAGSVPVSPD